MGSEIRRGSADDPGETGKAESASAERAWTGMAAPELSRWEIAELPDYDGPVPPPLEGADPGNEDAGEPAETTGLGEGYHSPEELRAWLAARKAGDGPAGDGGGSGDGPAGGNPPRDGPAGGGPPGDGPAGGGPPGGGPTGGGDRPRTPILHAHSEFQGQSLDLYSDGKNWASGEMIRARMAEEKEKERPRPLGPGDIGELRQRDFGDNTVGENPDVHLGDTRDRRTIGEKLGEEDSDPDKPRLQRLITKAYRNVGDVDDGAKNQAETVRNIFDRPQPTGRADVPVTHTPVATSREGHGGASPDSVTQLIVVGAIMVIEISRWMGRKMNEMTTRRHGASHG